MGNLLVNFANFLLNILFPKFCLGCKKEGSYLCQDCLATIEIMEYLFCPGCQKRVLSGRPCKSCQRFLKLDGLYFAASYQNYLIKELLNKFKYGPLIKELVEPLTSLIITHFLILGKQNFSEFSLVPIPLEKRRLGWRGFNQAEEIAKELAEYLKIPLFTKALIKIKKTLPQVEAKDKNQRKENIIGAFFCKNNVKDKKILLVDDVYTTGATMNEVARILKKAGAKKVWGVVVARG